MDRHAQRPSSTPATTLAKLALASLAAASPWALELGSARAEDEVALVPESRISLATPGTDQLRPPTLGPHAGSHGGTLVIDEHGLLVIERSAGRVVRVDRDGAPVATLALNPGLGLGEIVRDEVRGRVFVADRGANRIVEIEPDPEPEPDSGGAEGHALAIVASVAIREPHGLALSPGGETLLVTSVADHQLVGVDLREVEPRVAWRLPLAPEPRGVAISPEGDRAIVGFLTTGAVALLDLPAIGERPEPGALRYRSIEPRDPIAIQTGGRGLTESFAITQEARSRFEVPTDVGRRHARSAFAVGFVGHDLAVVAHQLATPQLSERPRDTGTYGGSDALSPITHQLALLGPPRAGGPAFTTKLEHDPLEVSMPRSLAYDFARDTLFVGGYGDDEIQAIVRISQQSMRNDWRIALGAPGNACGIDGLALDGDTLWAHCGLTRRVVRIDLGQTTEHDYARHFSLARGPELTPATRVREIEHGAELFRRTGDHRLTLDGTLACAMCHPEGRADGLTWQLEGALLQTPVLAGRTDGTAPYKWDGQDPTLEASIHATIARLGGFPDAVDPGEISDLRAYLDSLARPVRPTPVDPEALDRGLALFESSGCDTCHSGSRLTDRHQHPLATALGRVDTPSLIGLAHSAPYYHDGSAVSLDALLDDRSTIHDMADTADLTIEQRADLVAYLKSL